MFSDRYYIIKAIVKSLCDYKLWRRSLYVYLCADDVYSVDRRLI